MLSLKNKAEIYRIGLITGYFTKNDVISWVDKLIETEEKIEYKFIEVSLLANSGKINIASKLTEVCGIADEKLVVNVVLGLHSNAYNTNKFTAQQTCIFLDSLISHQINISISSHIEEKINYLSDGYYLASQGIYGDLEDIHRELKDFLDQYTDYAKLFN